MRFLAFFIITIIICFNSYFSLYAQKETYNWTFSDFTTLSFNNDSLNPVEVEENRIYSNKWNRGIQMDACISDSAGNLLFYLWPRWTRTSTGNYGYDSSRVVNASHQILENGEGVKCAIIADNAAVILPVPENKGLYYLFTLYGFQYPIAPPVGNRLQLYRHLIDPYYNNGQGRVIEKNVLMYDFKLAGKLAAVKYGNGRDWWLFSHEQDDTFVRWLVTPYGIQGPFKQKIGFQHGDNRGEMLFSPAGDKLAICTVDYLQVFNFDRCTGLMTDIIYSKKENMEEQNNVPEYLRRRYFGCSFSPSGNFVYASSTVGRLVQIDLTTDTPVETLIFLNPAFMTTRQLPCLHELAPNGKIYIASLCAQELCFYNPDTCYVPDWVDLSMSVIHYPDSAGLACHFAPFSKPLTRKTWGDLPHFPNYQLGPVVPSRPPSADAGPDKMICKQGTAVAIGKPALPGRSYQWSPTTGLSSSGVAQPLASPTETTAYALYVVDSAGNTCGSPHDTMVVYVNALSFTPNFSYNLDGFTATFYSNVYDTLQYLHHWDFGDGHTSELAVPTHTYLAGDTFHVTLTIASVDGCTGSVSKALYIQSPNHLSPSVQVSGIKVYPNPTRGVITVHCPLPEAAGIELFDATGRVVLRTTVLFPHTELDIAHLPIGIYTVKIDNSSTKFVKQE